MVGSGAFFEWVADARLIDVDRDQKQMWRLAARYGLRQEGITGLSPDAEPDPQRLAELADLVKRDDVTTIFTEDLVSPELSQTLARETGATTAVLSPLEVLTGDAPGADYFTVMRDNLAKLRVALGCP